MPFLTIAFPVFDPIAIAIGPIAIRWYALAYICGIVLGWIYARALIKNEKLWGGPAPVTLLQMDDFILWVTVGIILGGRTGYVLFYNLPFFVAHPAEIFELWKGGMSFHGGFLGCVAAVILFCRKNKLPILSLLVDPEVAAPSGPASAPGPGKVEDYIVSAIDRETLKGRFLPHLIDCCKGIEIAVGRRLPALRETVCAKLTRDAAMNALKIAGASALADKIPFVGIVLGAFASAGDMVAITGIQMMLMLQIGAVFGKEPDMQRMWELLPIVGGGFGWRMLSRELSGFIPVAGIFIKGAIAYAGTIVVGESVTFYFLHGRHMSPSDASTIYADAKTAAMRLGREIFSRLRSRRDP